MTSQPGLQIIAIHMLTNILRSKVNQAMKFGQLLRYNTRNVFLEKSYTKFGGEKRFSDLSLKKQNWKYFWINSLKFYKVCFYCMPNFKY